MEEDSGLAQSRTGVADLNNTMKDSPSFVGNNPVVDNGVGSTTSNGLEELLNIAQEYEAEETPERSLPIISMNHTDSPLKPESVGPSAENEANKKDNHPRQNPLFKGVGLKGMVSEIDKNQGVSSHPVFHSRSISKAAPCSISPKDANHVEDNNEIGSIPSTPVSVGPSRSNFTVPQPFSLQTEKRASAEHKRITRSTGDLQPRTPELIRNPNSKVHMSRSVCSESSRYPANVVKKTPVRHASNHDDDDTMSISSVQSRLSQAPKAKASRFTSANEFKFQSDIRAEKRKEYYSKLQEKLHAKEEENNQIQAKTKKEVEQEIKILRKNLTFKASPLPRFYHEGRPPKTEVPKIPATRAKSPSFSRRNSHPGSCCAIHCQTDHSSVSSPHKTPKGHDKEMRGSTESIRRSSGAGPSVLKSPRDETSGTATPTVDSPLKETEFHDVVTDITAKIRDPLTISPDLLINDQDVKLKAGQVTETKVDGSITMPKQTKGRDAVNAQTKERNVTKGSSDPSGRVFLPTSSKSKSDRKVQPVSHDDIRNLSIPGVNGNMKKERVKALTPYFRKQESSVNTHVNAPVEAQ